MSVIMSFFRPAKMSKLSRIITANGGLKQSLRKLHNVKATATAVEGKLDEPIKFSSSGAAKWSARDSLSGDPFPDAPWYQPYVVVCSVGCFLLYFLYLREENDMDEYIDKPLWEKVPSLEKQQLKIVLDYNLKHNIDTTDIVNRLKVIEAEEARLREHLGKK